MPSWLIIAVVVIAFMIIGVGWIWFNRKLREQSAHNESAAKLATASEMTARGAYWAVQKLVGFFVFLLGCVAVYAGIQNPGFIIVAGLILVAYGSYLLWPGSRSFWISF